MGSPPLLALEVAAVVAAVALAQCFALAVRDPARPAWLRGGWAEALLASGLVAVVSGALAMLIIGLNAAGTPVLPAMVLALAVAGLGWWTLWRLFAVGDRLALADSGHSPWRRPPAPSSGADASHSTP